MRPGAAKCRSLCQIHAKIQDHESGHPESVLFESFADPALGEFVLADDTLGVDPQEHIHAVPGPLRYLGGVDAAIQPRGQAGMPEIVRAPGERRGLLRGTQSRLAGIAEAFCRLCSLKSDRFWRMKIKHLLSQS